MSEILVSEEQLPQKQSKKLGATLAEDYRGKDPLVICIPRVLFSLWQI